MKYLTLLLLVFSIGCEKKTETEKVPAVPEPTDTLTEPEESTEAATPQAVIPTTATPETTPTPITPEKPVGVLLLPGGATLLASLADRPMRTLKTNLEAAGYENVTIIDYPNNIKTNNRESIEDEAITLIRAAMDTTPGKYIVIGHSFGHYVAMAAVLRGQLSDRVTHFIGLAGSARGSETAPSGCVNLITRRLTCTGLSGLIIGQDEYLVDSFIASNQSAFDSLNKCSIAIENDRTIVPADSGFLTGGTNKSVDYSTHGNLPSHENTVQELQDFCGI